MIPPTKFKKNGFRVITNLPQLYINRSGQVYNMQNRQFLALNRKNNVTYQARQYSAPKMVLAAFGGQPYQMYRKIIYKDGNNSNITLANLSYKPTKASINPDQLLTAIRCYVQVAKRYKVRDTFNTRNYLRFINNARQFANTRKTLPGIEIFAKYVSLPFIDRKSLAKEHGLKLDDCSNLINSFLSTLINEILADLENGKLHIIEYQPRKKSDRQLLAEWNRTIATFQKEIGNGE